MDDSEELKLNRLQKIFAILGIAYTIILIIVLFFFKFLPLDKDIVLKFFEISQVVLPAIVAAAMLGKYKPKLTE